MGLRFLSFVSSYWLIPTLQIPKHMFGICSLLPSPSPSRPDPGLPRTLVWVVVSRVVIRSEAVLLRRTRSNLPRPVWEQRGESDGRSPCTAQAGSRQDRRSTRMEAGTKTGAVSTDSVRHTGVVRRL